MEMWLKCRKWVEENGGYVGNITMGSDRRVRSLGPILLGESLMVIPRMCQILGTSLSLGIRMLIQELRLGKRSFYDSYLQLLPQPQVFESHPFICLHIKRQHTLLDGPEEFKNYMSDLIHQFAIVQEELATSGDNFSMAELTYGFLCFQTRAWVRPDGTISLIPIMDMLNHKALPNMTGSRNRIGLVDSDGNYSMICGERYNQGDEITDYYGCKNNIMLFVQYNFRDTWPIEPIDIAVDQDDPKRSEYELALKYFEPMTPALDGNGWNECLIAFCRILVVPDSIWPTLKSRHEYYFTEPLEPRLENIVYRSLKRLILDELEKLVGIKVHNDMLQQVIKDKILVFQQTLAKIKKRTIYRT